MFIKFHVLSDQSGLCLLISNLETFKITKKLIVEAFTSQNVPFLTY